MADDNLRAFRYRVLRYTPNLIRDEWVNIGILLEETEGLRRRRARLIEEGEMARVRRLHPDADEAVLRALPSDWEAHAEADEAYLRKLEDTLSNVIQLTEEKAVLAEDFDAELDRLYQQRVAPPPRSGRAGALLESTRGWIRAKLNDVFRRHRILAKLERNIRVDEFTEPGDPMKLDYGYRRNGTRGFLQAFSLARDVAQAKALAYTAQCIRARIAKTEFTAITEIEPQRENARHQFVAATLAAQDVAIVPLSRIELVADQLHSSIN
jgi:hypothetical protein